MLRDILVNFAKLGDYENHVFAWEHGASVPKWVLGLDLRDDPRTISLNHLCDWVNEE